MAAADAAERRRWRPQRPGAFQNSPQPAETLRQSPPAGPQSASNRSGRAGTRVALLPSLSPVRRRSRSIQTSHSEGKAARRAAKSANRRARGRVLCGGAPRLHGCRWRSDVLGRAGPVSGVPLGYAGQLLATRRGLLGRPWGPTGLALMSHWGILCRLWDPLGRFQAPTGTHWAYPGDPLGYTGQLLGTRRDLLGWLSCPTGSYSAGPGTHWGGPGDPLGTLGHSGTASSTSTGPLEHAPAHLPQGHRPGGCRPVQAETQTSRLLPEPRAPALPAHPCLPAPLQGG